MAALLAAEATSALPTAEVGVSAPSRIVDRTFRCTPLPLAGGFRDLDVATAPRGGSLPRGTVRAVSSGYIGIGSGPDDFVADLVAVRARLQERALQRPLAPGVHARVRRCAGVRASVPLSPRGLPGPPVGYTTDGQCAVRGRVLVRVRATLQSPAFWRPVDRLFVGVRRNVIEAMVAVRSERTRRPIAFMVLGRSGTTRLWTSGACG
jgi:hypothetical protein